ncbi:MAG: tetratricopeptide repeat protein, partial [Chitinophagales bacterium]
MKTIVQSNPAKFLFSLFCGMKFLWRCFILVFIHGLFFCSCNPSPKSNHASVLSAEDSLLILKWKSESRRYYTTNQDSFATIQLKIAALYKQAGQPGNWLNCYDTIIMSYRRHDQLEKAVSYFEKLYKDIWHEPTDSISLITLAESNRQMGFIYYNKKSEYGKALPFYDEAIQLMTKADGWNPEAARTFYKAAGNCSARMDDYQKSINYHQ